MTTILVVSIDTEEEFNWAKPFSSANRSVRHVAELPRLQEVFDECGVRPTYLVDHPIATTDKSIRVLDEFRQRDGCEIGAHLHPWVNPPLREEVNARNSYLCNLPPELQREKLVELTGVIQSAFGVVPTSFKAGRYGLDFAFAPVLRDLGYRVDTSVRALEDLGGDGGPSFAEHGPEPCWIAGDSGQPLLEVPCSGGFNRRPFLRWARIHRSLGRLRWGPFRPIGLLWHLRLLRKIALTPEGHALDDLKRLTRTMVQAGCPVLHLSLHSPSCAVGNTPYVCTEDERQRLLATLYGILRYATGELNARPRTLSECAGDFAGRPFPVRRA